MNLQDKQKIIQDYYSSLFRPLKLNLNDYTKNEIDEIYRAVLLFKIDNKLINKREVTK